MTRPVRRALGGLLSLAAVAAVSGCQTWHPTDAPNGLPAAPVYYATPPSMPPQSVYPPAPALNPAPSVQPQADADPYVGGLLAVLQETKSADAFLLTLDLLVDAKADHRHAVPVVLRHAERLGLLADHTLEGGDSPEAEVCARVMEAVGKLAGRRVAAPPAAEVRIIPPSAAAAASVESVRPAPPAARFSGQRPGWGRERIGGVIRLSHTRGPGFFLICPGSGCGGGACDDHDDFTASGRVQAAGGGREVEWSADARDGAAGSVRIDGEMFDLAAGDVFRIDLRDGRAAVEQLAVSIAYAGTADMYGKLAAAARTCPRLLEVLEDLGRANGQWLIDPSPAAPATESQWQRSSR